MLPEIDRRCGSCGVAVRRRAKFCPQCGERIVDAQASPVAAQIETPDEITSDENQSLAGDLSDSNLPDENSARAFAADVGGSDSDDTGEARALTSALRGVVAVDGTGESETAPESSETENEISLSETPLIEPASAHAAAQLNAEAPVAIAQDAAESNEKQSSPAFEIAPDDSTKQAAELNEGETEAFVILTIGESPSSDSVSQIHSIAPAPEKDAIPCEAPVDEVSVSNEAATESASDSQNDGASHPRAYSSPIFASFEAPPKKFDKLARKASELVSEGKQRAIERFGEDTDERDIRFIYVVIALFLFSLVLLIFHAWLK